MFIKRLCLPFACLVVLLAPHSSMGSDFPRRFAIESPSPDILTEVAVINDGLSAAQGIQFINWGSIQTNAPIDGVNIYEPFASNSWWAAFLDGLDTTDRGLVCTLEFLETPWAIERSTNTMVQNPLTGAQEPGLVRIYPAYTNTWQEFIKYLLEVTPQITHLQIDSEPENVWVHAPGYIEALNLAYDAVQEFNAENPGRDVVVLAAGFYLTRILMSEMSQELVQRIITNYPAKLELAVLQQYYPSIAEEVLRGWSQKLHLVVGVLSQEDPVNPSFDILSLHHDKDKTYDRAGDLVAWYRNHMSTGIHGAYDRPIWLDDMASNYVPGNSTDEDRALLEQLENGDEATIAEFNRGQSSWLVKKAVGHFGAGFERVSIAYGQDAPDYFLPIWRYMGLFYTNNVPKPAYYTTQLMVENLDGFTSATRLQQADTNNYLYRFSFAAKPDVFVAWRENEGMMDLSEYTTGTTLRATHLVMETTPEGDAIWPPQEGVPAASVPVTPLPVFLVATDSPLDTYVVIYNVNGATSGTAPASQTKTNDVALTLASNSGSLAKTGYTFVGWNTATNGSGTDYTASASYTANAAVILYAKWTANTYAVTYNVNGATSGTAPASQTKTSDVALTLQTNSGSLAKTGYTFAGWNTAANGSGTTYAAGGSYTANAPVTLYAEWVITYDVTYSSSLHTGGSVPDDQDKVHDEDLTLDDNSVLPLVRTGFVFSGWTNGVGEVFAAGSIYNVNAALDLYPRWTELTWATAYPGATHADFRWANPAAGGNWAVATNWNVSTSTDGINFTAYNTALVYPGQVAPAASQFATDAQLPLLPNEVVVNSSIPETAFNEAFNFSLNGDDNALRVANGGDITFDAGMQICYDSGNPDGRMTIYMEEGGRLATSHVLLYKSGSSYCLIEMTGGLIEGPGGTETALATYYEQEVCDWTINLHGGTIRTSGGRFFSSYNPPTTGYENHDKLLDIQGSGVLELGLERTPGLAGVTPTTGSNGAAGATRGEPGIDPAQLITLSGNTVYKDGDLRWGYDGSKTYAWAAAPPPPTSTVIVIK